MMFSVQPSRSRQAPTALLLTAALAATAGCSGPAGQNSLTAPSAVTAVDQTVAVSSVPDSGSKDVEPSPDPMPPVPLPPAERSGPAAVSFPPRTEALLFRTALEAKYRDGLRRSSVLTFVDQEGTVVWVQEYLRYRVNLCSHVDAILRVFQQIDGFGIQPVCGVTNSATFPPRQQPLDFMVQLEAKYRDSLRRTAGPTYVDVEGNVIWVQEYFRYRVSGCDHPTSQQKAFDQIDGRGVPADCGSTAPGGGVTVTGTLLGGGLTYHRLDIISSGTREIVLTWADGSVDLDLALTDSSCTVFTSSCRFYGFSIASVGTSERLSLFMRAGESYNIWVENASSRSQSYNLSVRLTGAVVAPLTGAGADSAGPQSGARGTESPGVLKQRGSGSN